MAGRALDIAQVVPAGPRAGERRGEWRRFAANHGALVGAVVLAALALTFLFRRRPRAAAPPPLEDLVDDAMSAGVLRCGRTFSV